MWRWQSIKEVEYPIIVNRTPKYNKVLVEGLEWIVPGHEHTDVAVIAGQNPRGHGNADKMAEYEFRFDRADIDAIGLLDGNNNQVWPGKDNVNNNGTAGHQKAVSGVTWLQTHHPLQSYVIPTHTERAGVFNPTGSNGYNIEHFRDFNNAGPTVAFGIESPGHMAQGNIAGGSGSYGTGAVGGGTYGFSGVYTAKVGGLWDGLLGEGRNFFPLCQFGLAQSRRGWRTRRLHDQRLHTGRVHQTLRSEFRAFPGAIDRRRHAFRQLVFRQRRHHRAGSRVPRQRT